MFKGGLISLYLIKCIILHGPDSYLWGENTAAEMIFLLSQYWGYSADWSYQSKYNLWMYRLLHCQQVEGDRGLACPKWPSLQPSTTFMANMHGPCQELRGFPTIHLYIRCVWIWWCTKGGEGLQPCLTDKKVLCKWQEFGPGDSG